MKSRLTILICTLTLFCIQGCPGGGRGAKGTLAGIAGDFCVTADGYKIVDSQGTNSFPYLAEPFYDLFLGNLGGQVRAATHTLLSLEDREPATIVLWGQGSSVRGGLADLATGTIPLKNEGVVTDMATFGDADNPKIVYGSRRGLGIITTSETNGSGFTEKQFKTIPSGVISVAAVKDGSAARFYFVTGDGYVLTTTEGLFTSDENCYGIIASPATFSREGVTLIPHKVRVSSSKIFILAGPAREGGLTPTLAQAIDPIMQGILTDSSPHSVHVIDRDSKSVTAVAFPVATNGFTGFDRFIPTDIAVDGTNFYVAGFGYEKAGVDSVVVSYCDQPDLAERVSCMRELAQDGTLITAKNAVGLDAVTGGFFIYRDLTKLEESADFFARVSLPSYLRMAQAPAVIFHMAVKDITAAVRAPNFLSLLEKTVNDVTGEERWVIKYAFDGWKGVMGGLPANVDVFTSGGGIYAAATAVAPAIDSFSLGSMLDVVSPEGTLSMLDSGAAQTLMEDGAGNYLAAVELISNKGGMLYLENISERKWISASADPQSYVTRAAYDGSSLAFSWSAPNAGWNLSWQNKDNEATRGTYSVAVSGDSKHFVGFPDVGSSEVETLKESRGILDMSLSGGKLFVLYYGYYEGKHYYQVGIYGATLSGETYQATHQGSTYTVSFSGDEADHRGRFQKITKNSDGSFTALFSCAGGLRQFRLTPSSSSPPTVSVSTKFSASNVMDLDLDEAGTRFAFITGKTIRLRDLAAPTTDLSATSLPQTDVSVPRLSYASLVLTPRHLFVATPVGAASRFWVLDVSQPATPTIGMRCSSCDFNGLATFSSFGDQLLASSETGGVEIYDISNLD